MGKYSDEKLLRLVNNLMEDCKKLKQLYLFEKGKYRQVLISKYSEFSQDYPSLFNSITDYPDEFKIERLFKMLEQKKEYESGKISYLDQSKKIASEYNDEFVFPVIKK